jgi:polyphosphate kinase
MRASIPFSPSSKRPRRIPNVIAIKQILYRTAKNSRIISALIRAAQAGKHVTVLVELKARFDEARNLERANDLINAGAQIIYGVAGLKTHAKVCLVMRRESGHMTRYMHFGTGNYNEATSKLYTDISLLTCRAEFRRGCLRLLQHRHRPLTLRAFQQAQHGPLRPARAPASP